MYIPVNEIHQHFKAETPIMSNITHKQDLWSPYHDNSGTVLAIGIPGAVIVAGDTRLSNRYLNQLINVFQLLQVNMQILQHQENFCNKDCIYMNSKMKSNKTSTQTVAHLLSRELYSRRFFPYYIFNLLAGLDENNHGVFMDMMPLVVMIK